MYRMGICVVEYFTFFMLVVLMSACTSNVISIDSKDRSNFTTLETSVPVSDKMGARLKLRASRAEGVYSQTVPDGKLILIDDIQIRGPTDVGGTTELSYGSISVGSDNILDGGEELQHRLLASVYFGLAQTLMDLTLVHDGATYRINDRTTEFYMQGGVSYKVTPEFYAGGTYAMSMGPDLTGISEADLRMDYILSKHLQVMGGYRWLEYSYLVQEDDSIVRVEFRGPFIGLYMPF